MSAQAVPRVNRKRDLPDLLAQLDLGKHAFLLVAALLTYAPFWIMFTVSFKDQAQFFQSVWAFELPLHGENYVRSASVVGKYILNSIFVTAATVIGVVVCSSLAAFAFARYRFPGKQALFWLVISLLMVPSVLTMVPAFVLVKQMGLLNSHWGLILPSIASNQVFAIFIMRGFMASLPEELFESARIDGASIWHCYFDIALPLSRPGISVVVITTLLTSWNDFIWPLLIISDDRLRTVPIGLAFFQTQFITDYGPLMAGYVISSLPLLLVFILTSREFIRGLTAGAVKF
jgi:ABC-type glycerol-3-phosphate transport system permease component